MHRVAGQSGNAKPPAPAYWRDVCNGERGVLRVPLKNRYAFQWDTAPVLGDAYIYRTYSDGDATKSLIYITVALRGSDNGGSATQLYYQEPYPLAPENDDGEGLFMDMAASLYLWTDARNVTYKQYVNPMVFSGLYTCFTFVLNLQKICDPARSYRNPAARNRNEVCTCRPEFEGDCDPVDISTARDLFIVLNVNGVPYSTASVQMPGATCAPPPSTFGATVLSNSNGPGIITQFTYDPYRCANRPPAPPPPISPPVPPSPPPSPPVPPSPPPPPPNLGISATISITTFNPNRFFSSGYDCGMGRNATLPYYRNRTTVTRVQCTISSIVQTALNNDFGMISWTYYFNTLQNLDYFFRSVNIDVFWSDLFSALTPGCGAVGNYTDSVYNRNGLIPPVPIWRQNTTLPQPFCAYGGTFSQDGCW
ncbi:hypothetical protein GPECTOR_960g226 [Gonium pectorale]|uniref:Uncharacterized protein n=1 Tax=Gonium pectorale TaxID=33097 RepID=A0A150FTT6_GONPE|nr:hypothetical protein GPECTOR_960g226 [Gonium pectorale]|eukprot:KXZ41024.1 hypothetical protein GPECTOR_960g226 [Gonium pectorale]